MAKIGDIVRYLNTVGGGRITRIDGKIAYVDEDGFETPVLLRECVVVTPAPLPTEKPKAVVTEMGSSPQPQKTSSPDKEPVYEIKETPEGENLNVVLGYEALNIKRLSASDFDTYLVNDSNYCLSLSYLTHDPDDGLWHLRYAAEVEPGMMEYLGELKREELAEIDRIAVQLTAYKRGKPFGLKSPVSVEYRFDATKFCRLHCFQPNPYFDAPVIAYDIVKDDSPAKVLSVSPDDLHKAMAGKAHEDNSRTVHPKQQKKAKKDEPLEVDLHISELLDNTNGLSNSDMLNVQIDAFRKAMDANIHFHGKKIVFIHGKGEGVLRKALLKELNYRYKGCEAQDASFREYGFGATLVKIK